MVHRFVIPFGAPRPACSTTCPLWAETGLEGVAHGNETLPMGAPVPMAPGRTRSHTTGVMRRISLRNETASRRIFMITAGELRVDTPLVRGK